jgi:NADH-quinone oxidoreductase subunit J
MLSLDLVIAIFTAIFASVVVFARSPLVSAFSLLITFLGVSAVYFQLGSLFLTAVQVLVYAGAIAILFIFVLMLMNLSEYKIFSSGGKLKPIIGGAAVLFLFGILTFIIDQNVEYLNVGRIDVVQMSELFVKLFTTYLVPFELATMLLLASIVASILISQKSKDSKKV